MAEVNRINELLIAPQAPQLSRGARRQPAETASFADLLNQARSPETSLRFSAHAQNRIQSRQIQMGAPEIKRIESAVQSAAGKGARESLVLLDQTALVVSVPNRTVITVVDRDQLKQNVFTNIDSAVFA